jgi:hypothetical protein
MVLGTAAFCLRQDDVDILLRELQTIAVRA